MASLTGNKKTYPSVLFTHEYVQVHSKIYRLSTGCLAVDVQDLHLRLPHTTLAADRADLKSDNQVYRREPHQS
jgi:hypothetical protein